MALGNFEQLFINFFVKCCYYEQRHTWNRSKLPSITVHILTIFRAWLVVFFLQTSDMPTLPITAGDSRFESFNLSPAQFSKSSRNSRFYRDIHTKIFKMTYNWQKFYTWTFKCRPRGLRILEKKIQNIWKKRWSIIQS